MVKTIEWIGWKNLGNHGSSSICMHFPMKYQGFPPISCRFPQENPRDPHFAIVSCCVWMTWEWRCGARKKTQVWLPNIPFIKFHPKVGSSNVPLKMGQWFPISPNSWLLVWHCSNIPLKNSEGITNAITWYGPNQHDLSMECSYYRNAIFAGQFWPTSAPRWVLGFLLI